MEAGVTERGVVRAIGELPLLSSMDSIDIVFLDIRKLSLTVEPSWVEAGVTERGVAEAIGELPLLSSMVSIDMLLLYIRVQNRLKNTITIFQRETRE